MNSVYYIGFYRGDGFLGGAYVEARDQLHAAKVAREQGVHPGGEHMAFRVQDTPPASLFGRLLSRSELDAPQEKVKSPSGDYSRGFGKVVYTWERLDGVPRSSRNPMTAARAFVSGTAPCVWMEESDNVGIAKDLFWSACKQLGRETEHARFTERDLDTWEPVLNGGVTLTPPYAVECLCYAGRGSARGRTTGSPRVAAMWDLEKGFGVTPPKSDHEHDWFWSAMAERLGIATTNYRFRSGPRNLGPVPPCGLPDPRDKSTWL